MIMLYNNSLIMWKSKMEKTTALSTAGAEYYSLLYSASADGCEVLYLRALLARLAFKQKKPTPIHDDNSACIRVEWGHQQM
jgi:hypothetical protein